MSGPSLRGFRDLSAAADFEGAIDRATNLEELDAEVVSFGPIPPHCSIQKLVPNLLANILPVATFATIDLVFGKINRIERSLIKVLRVCFIRAHPWLKIRHFNRLSHA
jgi:hypothetical protein